MHEKIREMATRIKALRESMEISPEDVAEHLKLSLDQYREYENGESDIPVSLLLGIASRLDVDMAVLLTGENPRMKYFTVTRKDKGVAVERRSQYKYQNLASNFIHKKAEPLLVTVEPKPLGKGAEMNSHPGQEFNYVVQGVLKIHILGNELILREGDSIYFNSECPHAMEAMENAPAKFLAIIF
ncbi:MAG: XRE family transcriptional regulator [Syntrophobacterales bacterium]|nr:XRE family transcriptional regulator [Syntrophobacterales bacterium]